MELLIALAFAFALRSAYEHVRDDYRRTRDQHLQKSAAKKGSSLTKAQRSAVASRHATGYWAAEILHGFPVTRTGWHAGWLAHKTAAEHQRAVRDAAQTTHLETVASFAPGRAEHKRRQEALREEISETIARAPEGQRTGRRAAQKARDEVAAKRAEREHRETAPPVVIDTPIRARNAENSDWLRPGESPCAGCGGSGRNDAGDDACPACRGFGSAPADPNSPSAEPGAICGACGRAGTPGDPVLAAAGGYGIHQSHAREQTAAYRHALDRMVRARNPQPLSETTASPTTTEGAPPVSDTSFATVHAQSAAMTAAADQDLAEIRTRRAQAQQMAEEMQAAGVNGQTLAAAMDLADRYAELEAAAAAAGEQASAVGTTLQREHGGIEEAVNDAPIPQPAQPEFYGQG